MREGLKWLLMAAVLQRLQRTYLEVRDVPHLHAF